MSQFKPYPVYKDSGVEWLGEVPAHWTVIALKWLSPVFRGASPRPIDNPVYFDDDGEFGWVRIADVTASPDGYLYETTQKLSVLGSSLSVKLDPGELFLSIAGSVGKPCITKIKACIHDGFVYFPWLSIDQRLLYRVFEAGLCFGGLGKMGTQLNLNTDTVGGICIAVPPAPELSRALALLDYETARIDALIEEQQRLIELLKEKRQAVISHAVTKGLDPTVPMKDSGVEWLGEVPAHWVVSRAKLVSDIFVPQRNKPELNDSEGVAWVTMEDMNGGYISATNLKVTELAANEAGSKVLKKGAVIASCIGRFGIVAINAVDVVINQQLQAFEPKKIKAEYLKSIVSLSKEYFELIGTAATLIYVNQQGFENLPVLLPSAEEQDNICVYVDEISDQFDTLLSQSYESIQLLQERRSALISAAVTGKIDLRGWQPPANVSSPVLEEEAV